MILDIVALGVVAWATFVGYRLGGMRMLIYVSAFVGTFYIVEQMTPWLQWFAHDTSAGESFRGWLLRLFESNIPAHGIPPRGSGPITTLAPASQVVVAGRTIYQHVKTLTYATVVYFGVVMGLRAIETMWPVELSRFSSRIMGIGVGVLLGITVDAYLLKMTGATVWYLRLTPNTRIFYESVVMRAWTGLWSRGIVN